MLRPIAAKGGVRGKGHCLEGRMMMRCRRLAGMTRLLAAFALIVGFAAAQPAPKGVREPRSPSGLVRKMNVL